MVIQLLNINFPVDFVLGSVFNGYWEISSVIEQTELRNWDSSAVYGSSLWLLWYWLSNWFVERGRFSSESISLLEDGSSTSSN
jgi:hypothetical protein